MSQAKSFPVSWDQFHRDCKALAWKLSDISREAGEWEAIISITRGGLVPAAIIARELGVRNIETVCIASYHEYKEQGELVILKPIADELVKRCADGENICLCQADRKTNSRYICNRSFPGHLDLFPLGP